MTCRLVVPTLALLLAAGCDEAVPPVDAGTPPPDVDAGPPPVRQLSYTPEGCDYEVSTPEVTSTGRGEDVFDEANPLLHHVHVSWAGPSDRSFAVSWETGNGTLASRILYGTDRAAVEAADTAGGAVMGQSGHTMFYRATVGGGSGTRLHEVHVCGLVADTTYYYKVGGPGHWSEVFETATAPPVGSTQPFSFAVTGDSRNNLENSFPISQRRIDEAGVDFEVFSGDAVFLGANQNDWNEWFEAGVDDFEVTDLMARAPMMLVNGNHEHLALPYVAQFAFPQDLDDGETANGEEWYSFDYGNAHFVMLNDTVDDDAVIAGAQADWLRADLQSVDRAMQPWIFVSHHRGFYTCGSTHSPDGALRAAWQPIFDEFAVDMVLTGHNHVYERSRPIRGLSGGEGVVAAEGERGAPTYDPAGVPSGTVYVVAAGVGAELYPVSTDCPTSFVGVPVRPYAIVEIEDRTLTYTAYDALTGAVIDSFALTK